MSYELHCLLLFQLNRPNSNFRCYGHNVICKAAVSLHMKKNFWGKGANHLRPGSGGHVADVIYRANFSENRSKGFGATGPEKRHFSLKMFIALTVTV